MLRERGHRVVFVVEESFAGTLEAQGFEERRCGSAAAGGRGGARAVLEGLHPRHRARLPQADDRAARDFIEPIWRALWDGSRYVHDRLREIFDELRPT